MGVLRGSNAVGQPERRHCGGFFPEAAQQWLLARCCEAVASLPDVAQRWLLARCCAAVASWPDGGAAVASLLSFVVECIAHGWRGLEGVEDSAMSSKMLLVDFV